MEKKELADWVRQVQKTEVVNTTRLAEWDQDAFQSVKEIWRNVRTKSFQCVGDWAVRRSIGIRWCWGSEGVRFGSPPEGARRGTSSFDRTRSTQYGRR